MICSSLLGFELQQNYAPATNGGRMPHGFFEKVFEARYFVMRQWPESFTQA
jgi:hypothetical protein